MKFNKPVKNYFKNEVIDTLFGANKEDVEELFHKMYKGHPYYDFMITDDPKPDFYVIRVFEKGAK